MSGTLQLGCLCTIWDSTSLWLTEMLNISVLACCFLSEEMRLAMLKEALETVFVLHAHMGAICNLLSLLLYVFILLIYSNALLWHKLYKFSIRSRWTQPSSVSRQLIINLIYTNIFLNDTFFLRNCQPPHVKFKFNALLFWEMIVVDPENRLTELIDDLWCQEDLI